MGAAAVVLTVARDRAEGSYSFVCPGCQDTVEKHADQKVVMLLLSAGVEVQEVGQLSLEADARQAHPAGGVTSGWRGADPARSDAPPFTVDDLIDFHFMLRDDRWFLELIAAGE